MVNIFSKFFDSNEKQLSRQWPVVHEISALEEEIKKLSDEDLRSRTDAFRSQLEFDIEHARDLRDPFLPPLRKDDIERERAEEQSKLFSILPAAYSVVREAARRSVVHRAFDVQVLAGIFLSKGYVTELFTGEGKSLVAVFPLYLYALTGKGAHLVTVNDYLARRDGEWVGHIFNALGMTVGIITPGASYRFISDAELVKIKGEEAKQIISDRNDVIKKSGRLLMSSMKGDNLVQCSKREAYACDIVYGTNNEFGFDYLRDNMARDLRQRVQDVLHYVIVDECDSILIDEARTPLIISSPAEDSNELYRQFARVAGSLRLNEDYLLDEKAHSVTLTDPGVERVEKMLNVPNIWENYAFVHHLDNALKAKELYKRDDHYLVQDGEIRIVDEFTGRVLPGRRYSEGLHQAIEAKEGVEVKRESKTLATITFQNLFRLYSSLSGMTGTALTEAEEFAKIYKLEVIVIPTNKPVVRKDFPDVVFRTREGKFKAVVQEIKKVNATGRPVLVGTTSVEHSELLSDMLKKEGVAHEVLNAKNHQREAMIVSQAGQKGHVTISTNMAGRGTDIALGDGVVELGGLHVLGTERHESRRIDNQLRGRSGRQGDPGSSRFHISFEDDLMRIFGGDAMGGILARVGMDSDMPIEAGLIGRSIEAAQKRVEAHNFDIRKHLVEYDDVLNQQREIIYDLRRRILTILSMAPKDDGTDTARKLSDISFDWNFFKQEVADTLFELVRSVSMKDSTTWNVEFPDSNEELGRPLRLWILRLALLQVDFVIASQTKDDAAIDDMEQRNILAAFLNIVPVELAEAAAKKLGYDDWKTVEKLFYEEPQPDAQRRILYEVLFAAYVIHILTMGDAAVTNVERVLILQTIDRLWVDHLDMMTDLRHGIDLRSYAQRDPLIEYKNEGFSLFDTLLKEIEKGVSMTFFKVRAVRQAPESDLQKARAEKEDLTSASLPVPVKALSGGNASAGRSPAVPVAQVDTRPGAVSKQKTVVNAQKVGRNDPCPCGSGKKYKKCCYPKYG